MNHNYYYFFLKINHATSPKLYRSYYPHRSRDSLSPVCGIFSSSFDFSPLDMLCHSSFSRGEIKSTSSVPLSAVIASTFIGQFIYCLGDWRLWPVSIWMLEVGTWMLRCSGPAWSSRCPGVSHHMWPGDIVTLATDLIVELQATSIGEIYFTGSIWPTNR